MSNAWGHVGRAAPEPAVRAALVKAGRCEYVAQFAWLLAQQRGAVPSDPLQEWLACAREGSGCLAGRASSPLT